MARRLPKPFVRPAIEILSGDENPRRWRNVRVENLETGDVVPDQGSIVRVTHADQTVLVTYLAGHCFVYNNGEVLWAFTKGSDADGDRE